MPQGMLEGVAIGGPRDGVKLSAAPRWDGRIRKPTSASNTNVTQPESMRVSFYQGHYVWKPVRLPGGKIDHTWRWVPHMVADQPKRNKARQPRSDKHDW